MIQILSFHLSLLLKRDVANRDQASLYVDLADVATVDQDLADACTSNTKRYIDLFYEAVQELLPEYKDKEVKINNSFIIFEFTRLSLIHQIELMF